MNEWRDRLDLLLDDTRENMLDDIFLSCLLEAVEEEILRLNEDGRDVEQELLNRCLTLWQAPAVKFRLAQLERVVWSRRLLPAMDGGRQESSLRESCAILTVDGPNSRLQKVATTRQPAISGDNTWRLLPVVANRAATPPMNRLAAGVVLLVDEEAALGEINRSVIRDGG